MKPLSTTETKLVLTREAAKILGCSMRQVRTLAVNETIPCWQLAPKSFAYRVEDLIEYRDRQAAGRLAGKVRGTPPRGFRPDISPTNRAKKPKRRKS